MDGIEGIEGNRVELSLDVQIDVIEDNGGGEQKNIVSDNELNIK